VEEEESERAKKFKKSTRVGSSANSAKPSRFPFLAFNAAKTCPQLIDLAEQSP
jgi:hypothetical protein